MRIRLETPTWFRRLISQAAQVTIVPILRVLEGLNLRETVFIVFGNFIHEVVAVAESVTTRIIEIVSQLISETVAITEQVIVNISGYITASVSELTQIVEIVTIVVVEFISLPISEIVSVAENVSAVVGEFVSRSVTEIVSITENVVSTIYETITITRSELVNVLENVNTILTGGGNLQWDYSVAYDQQGNQITLDLSSLQDNNTSTAVNIYYTPPAPSNPRRFVVGWNEGRWFMQINIHINDYTTGKQLIVTIRDSFGYTQTAVLNITGTGWYYVYTDFYEIADVKEVEFAPDTSVLGYIGISEVWFVEGF